MKKNLLRICAVLLCMVVTVSAFGGFFVSAASAKGNGKLLKIGVTEDLDTLNPFASNTIASYEVFLVTYDTLTTFDKNLNPVGDLARSWTKSSDNLTWTFKLRRGVKWHDGKPFTSADVKFTYEALMKCGQGMYAKQLDGIDRITTPDANTVVIHTKEPKANMLYLTAPILPEHIWGKIPVKSLTKYDNSKCIGTGPFESPVWKKGDACTLKKNSGYFRGVSDFDGAVFKLYANTDTMAQSLKLGEINVAEGLTLVEAKSVAAKSKAVKIYTSQSNSLEDLGFNCSTSAKSKGNKALTDPKVRRALDMALNKQNIINLAYGGGGVSGTTIIPKISAPWHYEPTAGEANSYSAKKAGQLLDSAGYSAIGKDGYRKNAAGNELNFKLFARSSSTQEVKAAQMVKSYLNKLHVGATITTIDDDALTAKITDLDYDMFIWGWGGDVDPTTLLDVVTSGEIGNISDTYYSNKAYDKLVTLQSRQIDLKSREKTVYDAQKILLRDCPYSILSYDVAYEVVRTDMIGSLTQTSKHGPIFFANTPYNYLHAAYATKTASAVSPVPFVSAGVVAVVVIVLVVVFIVRRKNKNPEDEE